MLLVACTLALACGGSGGDPGVAPSALAYARNPVAGTVGMALAPDAPAWDGGAPSAWSVAPALPAGLALDPVTGVVSGTPAAASPAAAYTVTASNAAGSASVALWIAVEAALAPPDHLGYASSPVVLAVGVPMAPGAPASDGGPVEVYAVEPALPAGLSLDPASGVISGTPVALAPETAYTVTASNAAGAATFSLRLAVLVAGEVWLSPASLTVTTRTSVLFDATVAGGGAIAWSASAGTIDASGLFPAPRSPGAVVVTAADAGGARAVATASVEVFPRTDGNVEVTLVEPVGTHLGGDTLSVSARVVSRYLLERVEADLDGTPIAMELGEGGLWSGQLDVHLLPEGTHLLRVAGIDYHPYETELFVELILARPVSGAAAGAMTSASPRVNRIRWPRE